MTKEQLIADICLVVLSSIAAGLLAVAVGFLLLITVCN